ncbi:MAG: MaoC family dehydratase N-terminal domain-containing protein [Gemmobacter sp.]
MDPARGAALAATLGLVFDPAAPLPPFFHQAYFWQALPPAALGGDGHPRPGGPGVPVPDLGLPRRMWAGGRLEFARPLKAGRPASRATVCETVRRTEGRTGPLAFVTLRHEIAQDGAVAVVEWQDLVYRAAHTPDAPQPEAPTAPPDADPEPLDFDATLLFRYSALTFNGHRIHYDADYARRVEGYPGPVVHGPLLAQLLMLRATRDLGALRRFDFRATAPLILGEGAVLCRAGTDLWVRGPGGRMCMRATAETVGGEPGRDI